MAFIIIAVLVVINVSGNARTLREALIYGVLAGVFLGALTGVLAGVALADSWRLTKPQAIALGIAIESAWKGPLLAVCCAIGYAMRGKKPQVERIPVHQDVQ